MLTLPQMNEQQRAIAQRYYELLTAMVHETNTPKVAAHLWPGLLRYLVLHIRPGSYLCAVLNNDLREATCRGDVYSLATLNGTIEFLNRHAPSIAWGSPGVVDEWIAKKEIIFPTE